MEIQLEVTCPAPRKSAFETLQAVPGIAIAGAEGQDRGCERVSVTEAEGRAAGHGPRNVRFESRRS